VIPGVGESTRAQNYRSIIQSARILNFKIIPVNIHWSSKVDMTNFITQADKKIPKNISNDYILGFSFGAYIAAVLSKKKNARGYIFCSLSPYFKENLKNIPNETKKYWGQKMMKSFKKYTFPKNVKSLAWFFIGSKDWEIAIAANKAFYKKWAGGKNLSLVKDAGHELNHKNYIKKVRTILKMLRT